MFMDWIKLQFMFYNENNTKEGEHYLQYKMPSNAVQGASWKVILNKDIMILYTFKSNWLLLLIM